VEKAALDPGPGGAMDDGGLLSVEGRIASRNYHGQHSRYTIRSHDSDILVLVKETGQRAPELGSAVRVRIDPAHVLQYQPAS
jgi:iron(III) transport system ATP-binding protein